MRKALNAMTTTTAAKAKYDAARYKRAGRGKIFDSIIDTSATPR
jgi:hypothetical protein